MSKNKIDDDLSKTTSVPDGMDGAGVKEIVDYLFSNGNRLLTATGAKMELSKDVQSLIAYFSGGEIIISRTHKYDGRVLAFLDLLRERNMPKRIPFYSDLGLISAIYKYSMTLRHTLVYSLLKRLPLLLNLRHLH